MKRFSFLANLIMSEIFCFDSTWPVGFPGFITTIALGMDFPVNIPTEQ